MRVYSIPELHVQVGDAEGHHDACVHSIPELLGLILRAMARRLFRSCIVAVGDGWKKKAIVHENWASSDCP